MQIEGSKARYDEMVANFSDFENTHPVHRVVGCEQGCWRAATLGDPPFNTKPGAPNNAAYHFADHLQRSSGQDVYLIGRPINGSTLMSWSTAAAENMAALLAEVESALAHDSARKAGLAVADYLLWSQGESDDSEATMIHAPKADSLEHYQHHFAELANVLTSQSWWSQGHSGFLACPMVENGWLSARNDFYEAPEAWPVDFNMRTISSAGLGDIGDRAHFNGTAPAEIGRRMFEVS